VVLCVLCTGDATAHVCYIEISGRLALHPSCPFSPDRVHLDSTVCQCKILAETSDAFYLSNEWHQW
jgi:hypothetical protein